MKSKTFTVRDKPGERTIVFNTVGGEVVSMIITFDKPRPLYDFISVENPRVSKKEFEGKVNGPTS